VTSTVLTTTATAARPAAPWRALPVLLLGAFLPILDAFIVNVGLATIGHELRAGAAALELTVSGYGVAYACSLVVGGRLGDRFGRRRLFIAGLAAFTAASTACGLAPNVPALIGFRVCQGLAAALMFPQVLGSIQANFTGPDRQRALAGFGAMAGAGGAVGQLAGGALLAADVAGLSWRPLFLVNLPVGLVALVLAPRLVPETRAAVAARLDVPGAVALAGTIALLLAPLTLGRAEGWPLWAWLCLAAVAPAAAGFVLVQHRQERSGGTPLLPPSLLRLPLARRALLACLTFATCIGGFLFAISITMQVAHGFGPMRAGLCMAPCALAFLGVSLFVGRWVARYGAGVLVLGGIVFAAGLAALGGVLAATRGPLAPVGVAVPLGIVGVGWAMVLTPVIGYVLAGLPADRAGLAGGVLSTALQIGLAVGASVVGSVLYGVAGAHPDAGHWRQATLVALAVETGLALATAAACARLRRTGKRHGGRLHRTG
jgi:MFS family permease